MKKFRIPPCKNHSLSPMAGKGAPLPLRLTLRASSRYHEDRRFIFSNFF